MPTSDSRSVSMLQAAITGEKGLKSALVRAVLTVPSWAFCVIIALRRFAYRRIPGLQKRLPAFVVSIGNITVGGTGKTPTVEHYVRTYLAEGKRVAVLTRGYGGKGRSKDALLDISGDTPFDAKTAAAAGDEPMMLARRLRDAPIVVCPDRYKGGGYAVETHSAEVLVLDDGFQHVRLARDLEIVTVDATQPFGTGCLLPKGTLREKPSTLRRADIIVLTHADRCTSIDALRNTIARLAPQAELLFGQHVLTNLIDLGTGSSCELSAVAGKRLLAFCGIGNPDSFKAGLGSLDSELVGFETYPDHHAYSERDLDAIFKRAKRRDAEFIVTTEKDMMRLLEFGDKCRGIHALAIEIEIASPE